MADMPPTARQPDLICPLVGAQVMTPALKEDPVLLRKAANDPSAMAHVVHEYLQARPRSSLAQTVEALSSAYCRAVVSENVSMAQSSAKIVNFSQQVAIALLHEREPLHDQQQAATASR